ncbi:hypothetical protein EI94DRAFT_1714551 [Lactarius quietus]|nr:hypothetical protein EI94DRAFT_1714551 [Lactarius quietus]
MPLDTIEDPFELSSYESVKQDFVIFYASRDDDGKISHRTHFAPADGPSGLIVYVGQRIEWKTGSNFFRATPWRIRSIPTVVKLQGSKEVGRLVEDEIAGDLLAFVGSVPTKDDEPLAKDEPLTKDEPLAKDETLTKDETPTKDEPLAKDEPLTKDEPSANDS